MSNGWQYDFFAGEWTVTCSTCREPLEGGTKTMLALIHKYHTKNECLGGW